MVLPKVPDPSPPQRNRYCPRSCYRTLPGVTRPLS
jgi:hypothetical protein